MNFFFILFFFFKIIKFVARIQDFGPWYFHLSYFAILGSFSVLMLFLMLYECMLGNNDILDTVLKTKKFAWGYLYIISI